MSRIERALKRLGPVNRATERMHQVVASINEAYADGDLESSGRHCDRLIELAKDFQKDLRTDGIR